MRLPWTGFGKRTIAHRLLGQASYLLQLFFRLLFKRGVDGLVLTTAPPTIGILYLALRVFRRYPALYWVMDVNPEQAVVMGVFRENSLPVRLLRWCNRHLCRCVDRIVVLDRFMGERLRTKDEGLRTKDEGQRTKESDLRPTTILPPWPLEKTLHAVPREENGFLKEHGLEEKRCVFMYSGNHSPVHPLETLLGAIGRVRDREDLAFLFIGGGGGKEAVERLIAKEPAGGRGMVRSLPYQPLERLSESLSAADVQIVVMGEAMVGLVHPCKIYGAMAVGRPVLFIGPRESPHGDLVAEHGFGWVVGHGEMERLAGLIGEISALPRAEREAIGARGRAVLEKEYNPDRLAGAFCELVEEL